MYEFVGCLFCQQTLGVFGICFVTAAKSAALSRETRFPIKCGRGAEHLRDPEKSACWEGSCLGAKGWRKAWILSPALSESQTHKLWIAWGLLFHLGFTPPNLLESCGLQTPWSNKRIKPWCQHLGQVLNFPPKRGAVPSTFNLVFSTHLPNWTP